jgi:hypothetical protein
MANAYTVQCAMVSCTHQKYTYLLGSTVQQRILKDALVLIRQLLMHTLLIHNACPKNCIFCHLRLKLIEHLKKKFIGNTVSYRLFYVSILFSLHNSVHSQSLSKNSELESSVCLKQNNSIRCKKLAPEHQAYNFGKYASYNHFQIAI